ncbi:MAG: hypothetical protein Kow0069_12870 [Promethearchaeota archaeon]
MKRMTNSKRVLALLALVTGLSLAFWTKLAPTTSPVGFAPSPAMTINQDDQYEGTGQALDLMHHANRTDAGVSLQFTNGTSDSHSVPLGTNWYGWREETTVYNLHDRRNWNNGTFNFGNDDGTYVPGENDTTDIQNSFQNWTFQELDTGNPNDMSGNYYDAGSTAGRNALELVMQGYLTGSYYQYTQNDYCQWTTSFAIPRGDLVDATLNYQVNPQYLANFNSWELRYYVNGVQIYSVGTYSLKLYGEDAWHSFSIPMGLWTNTTDVFSGNLGTSSHTLTMQLIYIAATASYSTGFTHIERQRLLLANVELFVQAEVAPDQIDLRINGAPVPPNGYGAGSLVEYGSWTTSKQSTFSCVNDFDYTVDLKADFNLFANKTAPKTNYETNVASLGTKFTTQNATMTTWDFYAYFNVPTGFSQTNFTLYYPGDWTFTWVSTPQEPTTNVLAACSTPHAGRLEVPVKFLTPQPDGYWRFSATSPNYVTGAGTYKNATFSPGPYDWTPASEFFAGDYLKVNATLDAGLNFTSLSSTQARLHLRFPNGTMWTAKSQLVSVSASGIVEFSPIQLPQAGGDYEVGMYEVFVTWNDTVGALPVNETGLYLTTITVKHYSELVPDQADLGKLVEGTTTSVKVSYLDSVSGEAIQGATVTYRNLTGQVNAMSEIAPGYYFAEILAPNTLSGDQDIQINASHPLYDPQTVNVTVEVVLKVKLEAPEYPATSVQWNDNLTVHLNYTRLSTGVGITGKTIQVTWPDQYFVEEVGGGLYDVHCNTSTLALNTLYTMALSVDHYGYEPATLYVDVTVVARATVLDVLMNGANATQNPVTTLDAYDPLNITAWYYDEATWAAQSDATIQLTGISASTYSSTPFAGGVQFQVDTYSLGKGTYFITILANKTNHVTRSLQLQVTVNSRDAYLDVWINGANATTNPFVELSLWDPLNLTFWYKDANGSVVPDSTLTLDGLPSDSYLETPLPGGSQYIINTNAVGKGTHYVSLSANKTNYISASTLVQVKINPRSTYVDLWVNGVNKTQNPVVDVTLWDPLNVTAYYRDVNASLLAGTIQLQGISPSHYSVVPVAGGTKFVINTDGIGQGVHFITVVANKTNYLDASILLRVSVDRRNTRIDVLLNGQNATQNPLVEIPLWDQLNVSAWYYDENGTLITDGTITLDGISSAAYSSSPWLGGRQFDVNTDALGIGTHFITVVANRSNYQQSTLLLRVTIQVRETNVVVQMNGKDANADPVIDVVVQEMLNVSAWLYDDNGTIIPDATVTLEGISSSTYSTTQLGTGKQLLVDTAALGTGTHFVTLVASRTNYQDASLVLRITILPREVYLRVFLNGTEAGDYPAIEVPVHGFVNITAFYYDELTNALVTGATFDLSGIPTSAYVLTTFGDGVQVIVDTGVLGKGITFFSLSAQRGQYKQGTASIELTVRQIQTNVSTVELTQDYLFEPGDDFTLSVFIEDLDFGGYLKDCEVTYEWRYGKGNLTDPDGDGVYTAEFTNLPEGELKIFVTVYRGPDYDIKEFAVTLRVFPTGAQGLPTWVIWLFVGIIGGIVGGFVAYQVHFKYPKVIRKVRGLRKSVKGRKVKDVTTKPKAQVFVEEYLVSTRHVLPESAASTLRGRHVEPRGPALPGKKKGAAVKYDETGTVLVKPAAKPAAESLPKPAAESLPKPAAESLPKPAAESLPKPAAKPLPKPVAKPLPKPVAKPLPKPAAKPPAKPTKKDEE